MYGSAAGPPPSTSSWPPTSFDYLHVVQVPIVLGRGVRLWDGLDGLHERYSIETVTVPSGATHLFFIR